ncbi:MAG: hypothetical protein V1494_06545 [Candidatus Diapherotrites archaeon]
MKQGFLLVLAVFFVLLSAGVSAIKVSNHLIEINVDRDGFAHVIENYELVFNALEADEFMQAAQENSSSLLAWQADYNWFFPRLGETNGLNVVKASYVTFDEKNNTLTLDYFIQDQIARIQKDAPRATMWFIADEQLSAFENQGVISIPEATRIVFNLPSGAEVAKESLTPKATVFGNSIVLSGVTTNYINITYSIAKPIAPTVNAFALLKDFFSEPQNIILPALIVIIVVALVFWKREKLREKIEGYVIEHSDLEATEPSEETEVELE